MNTRTLTLDELAHELVSRANRDAWETLNILVPNRPQYSAKVVDDAYQQVHIWYRTRRLFPQLTDWQQGLLVSLYWQKQMLTRLVNASPNKQPFQFTAQIERITSRLERSFLLLVSKIKILIHYESLCPELQTIFDQEYVRIPFSVSSD